LSYSRWVCVPEGILARIENAPNQQPAGVQLDHVTQPFSDCGQANIGKIYGFIHSPLEAQTGNGQVAEESWAQKNVLLILMIFLLAAVFLMLCIYCAVRLRRYRDKYLKEAKNVDLLKEEVNEMEMFGGTAGTKDDEVEMVQNPLVVQLQTLQENLNAKTKEEQEAELRQLQEENEARQHNLAAMRQNVETLAAELKRLQGDLERQNTAPVRPVIEDFQPHDTAGTPAVAVVVDNTPVRAPATQKTTFTTARPTRRKDLDN